MKATCRYVSTVCMHKKEPQKLPEHTSECVKSQNFMGACPQTPLTQSILWGPTFCICPGLPAPPPQSSRQPWGEELVKSDGQ